MSVGASRPQMQAGMEAAVGPPRRSTWLGTSWLMLTDIVGTSVLTYAGVARQLGWVPTAVMTIGLCPVAVYIAVIMCRARSLTSKVAGREPTSMGEAARLMLGGRQAAVAVNFLVYGFAFLGQASYLLVLGQALQGALYDAGLCLPTAVFYGCLCCLPIVVSVRHLAESVWLCLANLFIILAVLGIVMAQLANEGRRPEVRTFLFAENLTVFTVFGAATNIVYSYTGHWMYFELMAEMKEPDHFPRVFAINAPLQVVMYLVVAFWGYYFAGDQAEGYFLDNLPKGPAYRWASGLLFAHVAVAFLLKNVVLTRYLHGLLAPGRARTVRGEPGSRRAQLEYAGCAVFMISSGYMVANSVPFFMDFMGLIGGLLSGPISFLLPMAFYVGARWRAAPSVVESVPCSCPVRCRGPSGSEDDEASTATASSLPSSSASSGDAAAAARPSALARGLGSPLRGPEEAEAATAGPRGGDRALRGGLHTLDAAMFALIGMFTLLTMVVGTTQVLRDIAKHMGTYGPPFSCLAL